MSSNGALVDIGRQVCLLLCSLGTRALPSFLADWPDWTELTPHGSEYNGGDMLDPESGSVYRCKMPLEGDVNRPSLRGYIGISLLERSQAWECQGSP